MKTQLKKGFTLVEIMIVVVIIGLLAALAIPAFKKVRNNAVEKTLINDARQISSAAQQYCSENADTEAPSTQIIKFLNGNNLSSGVLIDPAGGNTGQTIGGTAFNLSITANAAGSYFTLIHPQFDRTISTNGKVLASSQTVTNGIIFNTVDGQPK